MLSHPRHAFRVSVQAVVLLAIGMAFFLRIPQVTGPSMLPRVQPGELVLINTLAYRWGPIKRGDIVALARDEATAQTFLKRVVALPGDRVRIERGTLFVNDRPVAEPYVSFPDARSVAEVTVPPHGLYVLGDNRAESEDSRVWGPVDENAVIGKAIAGLWPPEGLHS
ncbi:MAG TPA: signal peptidase I [Candidatus Lustribacter sp.]